MSPVVASSMRACTRRRARSWCCSRSNVHRTRQELRRTRHGQHRRKDPKNGESMKGTPMYDGVRFHRVIPGFMVQVGDPLSRHTETPALALGHGGPGYRFGDEIHPELKHDGPGKLSMATPDRHERRSVFHHRRADAAPERKALRIRPRDRGAGRRQEARQRATRAARQSERGSGDRARRAVPQRERADAVIRGRGCLPLALSPRGSPEPGAARRSVAPGPRRCARRVRRTRS